MSSTFAAPAQASSSSLRAIHVLLSVQTGVVILVSFNRLSDLAAGYVAANQFLRWVDLNNMLSLPLISVVAFYLLKKEIEKGGNVQHSRFHLLLNLAFLTGVYLLGVSYGDHEVTNYLHARFCTAANTGDLCRIIIFHDDGFSHWLFFAGFVLANAALLLFQVLFPRAGGLTCRDTGFLIFNGLFIGLGIFANLAFEEIGFDLTIVFLLGILALGLLWRYGRQPLFVYYSTAYTLGLVATFIYKGLPDS